MTRLFPTRSNPEEAALSRVESFSDGVLAIALTLLAFDLTVAGYREGKLTSSLLDLWPAYVAFLLSFIQVSVLWMNHHATFARLRSITFAMEWSNIAILLAAVVLSFPTEVLADAFQHESQADQQAAIVLYGAFIAFMGIAWIVFFGLIERNPQTWKHPGDRARWRAVRRRALIITLGHLVAITIGVVTTPWAALVLYFIFVVYRAGQARGIAGSEPAPDEVETPEGSEDPPGALPAIPPAP